MDTMSTYESLEVWKESRTLRVEISELSKRLPINEQYRLSDQMIRASRSVTANIAEGHGRYYYQENIQFCRQARGSLYELFDHCTVALDEKYIGAESFEKFREKIYSIIKMLNGYIKYLQKQREAGKESK